MADINKVDVKLMQSQRLDDTDQGGGQMTSYEVVSGQINNLFPDISRFDRVYGRVSIRKAYMAVQTTGRETYYGSHTILTEQAADPNVSVCFFSSKDWFDDRDDAKTRIEAYLVKGPINQLTLWGTHYTGTSVLQVLTNPGWPLPEVGDVLVLTYDNQDQFVRVIDVESEEKTFNFESTNMSDTYNLLTAKLKLGSQIDKDYPGEEANRVLQTINNVTKIYSTVAADASRYYGVSKLLEDVDSGDLQVRVNTIMTNLVPSASSETAITDAGVGVSVSPMIQTKKDAYINRTLSYAITSGSKIFIGEGILPGTFTWTGGVSLTEDGFGNVKSGSTIVGSIIYSTGIITFGDIGTYNGATGTARYVPACTPRQISETGAINIAVNNRGFVYTFTCTPIPEPGSLKVEYIAGGKWYSLWDQGAGKISGLEGFDVGSGTLNFTTGTVSVTLKAMPDVDSKVIFFWGKPSEYFDFSGETLPLRYKFATQHEAVARNTFEMSWLGDGLGPGEGNAGRYCIIDNGNGDLVVGQHPNLVIGWEPVMPFQIVGSIKYATGEIVTGVHASQSAPKANEIFNIKYSYGEPKTDTFDMPPRDGLGRLNLILTNTPILPRTFEVEWHTDVTEYELETIIDVTRDPTYIFKDNGSGLFEGDVNDGTTNWMQGTINYTTGAVKFHPDRRTVFPVPKYEWVDTAWLHPGVEQTRVFTQIQYLPTASLFPTAGSVTCKYCTTDGSNAADYSGVIPPTYVVKPNSGLEIVPGGLHVSDGTRHLIDGADGKLYTHIDGVAGDRTQVGTIDYVNKTFIITSDNITIRSLSITSCVGTGAIEPAMSMVFRAPGAPIRPGSAQIRATTGNGTIIEGTSNFAGDITGNGIVGHVDYNTGLCYVMFGKWVTDDATAQAQSWYPSAPKDGANVWKPYIVRASTIIMNAVVTSYLPLDPELLGLDPVRLPLDGKVPIFRDGYVVAIHHTDTYTIPDVPVLKNHSYSLPRGDVDLIEVYDTPDDPPVGQTYSSDAPAYVPEINAGGTPNYTYDKTLGRITFTNDFVTTPYKQPFRVLHRIEDMALASDVQITGHISITSPLTHNYQGIQSNPTNPTLVSSVLPSGDLQSRAYNEFVQASWTSVWSNYVIGNPPLANYNFVDFPITVTNKPSIKERWLILFKTTTTVRVVGEKFGVLADDIDITNPTPPTWQAGNSGIYIVNGVRCLVIASRQFVGEYYWKMPMAGFGAGWASGNCIRFNQDAANFPLWFVRTTLQAPPTEPVDNYIIQIRGDSS